MTWYLDAECESRNKDALFVLKALAMHQPYKRRYNASHARGCGDSVHREVHADRCVTNQRPNSTTLMNNFAVKTIDATCI